MRKQILLVLNLYLYLCVMYTHFKHRFIFRLQRGELALCEVGIILSGWG